MRRRRTLITSPPRMADDRAPVAHSRSARRGGPRRHAASHAAARRNCRYAGTESIFVCPVSGMVCRDREKTSCAGRLQRHGLEEVCVVERKDLNDLVRSFTVNVRFFIERLRRMSLFPDRLLIITAR